MFFYLSFLRPLPHSSDLSNYVSITPQVANDLRTFHLDDEIEIFYTWSSSLAACTSSNIISMTRKLTTWRKASSTYKAISIPLPPHAESGQEWRLLLSCGATPSFVIDFSANDFGARPFPVISMPVRLEARMSKNKPSGKQEQVERLYSIPSRSSEKHSTILRIREQTSFELDKKIWDSGIGLSYWISKLILSVIPPSNLIVKQLWTLLTCCNSTALKVVELGTGTGIVSMCLSTLLEGLGSQDTRVLATDLPSAIELLDCNITTNKPAYPHVDLQSLVLDWDDNGLPPSVLGRIDLIVMADVTYNTVSFPSLVRTLDKLVQSSRSSAGGRLPCIILAYKQRDPAERTLWSMLRNIGIHMIRVDKVRGAGDEEVEIWIWNECHDYHTTVVDL